MLSIKHIITASRPWRRSVVAETIAELFDEFARRFSAGERPDVGEYLDPAEDEADELAALLDAFLQAAPPPPPAEETVAMMEAWAAGEPPLLDLRVRRGLRRAQVVEALMKLLGLEPAKEIKFARYYHRLETGLLDPSRVDRRVFEALADALKARVPELITWRPPPLSVEKAYLRAPAASASAAPPLFRAARVEPEPPDEIDRLFGADAPNGV
jgi:hypothetical protein